MAVPRLAEPGQTPRTEAWSMRGWQSPLCPLSPSSSRETQYWGCWVSAGLSDTQRDRPHVKRAICQEALLLIFLIRD